VAHLTLSSSSRRLTRSCRRAGRSLAVVALAVLGLGLAPDVVIAQQPAAPAAEGPAGFLQVTAVTVRPAAVVEFEEYAKKAVAATAKVGGRPVQAYQPMYGNPNVYYFVVSLTEGKDLDSVPTVPQALMKTYGDAEGRRLLTTGRAAIESIQIERHNTVRRVSTNLRAGAKPSRYYQVMRTVVDLDMMDDYMNVLEKVKKAEEAQPNAVTAMRRVLGEGGPSGTVLVVRGFDTFAERAGWANQREVLRKVYGAEDDRLMNETITRAVVSRDSTVLAHRPDLSSQ
jgi:hypothetical protein